MYTNLDSVVGHLELGRPLPLQGQGGLHVHDGLPEPADLLVLVVALLGQLQMIPEQVPTARQPPQPLRFLLLKLGYFVVVEVQYFLDKKRETKNLTKLILKLLFLPTGMVYFFI